MTCKPKNTYLSISFTGFTSFTSIFIGSIKNVVLYPYCVSVKVLYRKNGVKPV